MRSFRQSNLESQLLLNQEHAKKMIAESQRSGHPEFYITVLEGIQLEIASILDELKEYEQPGKAGDRDTSGNPERANATGLGGNTGSRVGGALGSDHATL